MKTRESTAKWQGSVACVVGLSPDNVWEILEFGRLSRWDPNAIESSDIVHGDGFSEGSIRCVVFKCGNGSRGMLYERLLNYDSHHFSYTYALDENPLGYEGYMASIKLEDCGDGNTFVQWSFEMDPMDDGELEDSVIGAIKRVFNRRLASLEGLMYHN
ncbi:unnamed protein product [Calypogeia fissa]